MKRLLCLAVVAACGRGESVAIDAGPDAATPAPDVHAVAVAEDARRSSGVTDAMRHDRDPRTRRRAARALARIADAPAEDALVAMLSDDDAETVAWSAYGLGFNCKGREEAHVRALAARAASLPSGSPSTPVDARFAIARAMGRCGGGLAETTLATWVKQGRAWSEPAAMALGDVAARRGRLDEDTITVLLDDAEKHHDASFYPFARMDKLDLTFAPRLLAAARAEVSGPLSDTRVFAVRALSRGGHDAADDLGRIAADKTAPSAERAEAARSLAKLGPEGHAAAAVALTKVVPHSGDPLDVLRLAGDEDAVAIALLGSMGDRSDKDTQSAFSIASALKAPGDEVPATLARRLAAIRCTAASALANGAYDAEVLRACDAPGTVAFERARLTTLVRRPLVGDRRTAWLALCASKNAVIVEAALEALDAHPELGETGRAALVTALDDARPGVVATAADRVQKHPERMLVLSAKERRNALDPRAPPPSLHPAEDVSPGLAKALDAALGKTWKESFTETRTALLGAAVAVRLPSAKAHATTLCKDPNTTIRDHAQRALRVLGDTNASCPAPADTPVATELASPHGGTLRFDTDSGKLSIVLDPSLAPVTATRIADLAKAGFYEGVVVHRVVPGFVAQFGDPGADGFGGADKLLRCETSPVPFGPLDVGVALAGRDTGSSQLFVTLSRVPHLDGDYARIGHAEGDWAAVAEGDVVRDVHVDD